MLRKFTQWFDNPPPKNAPENYPCDHPGCLDTGIYRAPKSRGHLEKGFNDWYWLCLIHVRDYNNSWNYYTNMSETEITHERQKDVTWERPTWPLHNAEKHTTFQYHFEDPFGFFDTGSSSTSSKDSANNSTKNFDQEALDLLNLSIPFTRAALQKNYRLLVKQYHPDTNQGNLQAEEMIRKLNHAYAHLQKLIA